MKKIYISFDYDNDKEIKHSFISQVKQINPSLKIIDFSIAYSIDSKWKVEARSRIKQCNYMIVLCGLHTDKALGVTAEISIAREEKIPYILIDGRKGKGVKPIGTLTSDLVHKWKWKKLKGIL
jgi:hypothetical protein